MQIFLALPHFFSLIRFHRLPDLHQQVHRHLAGRVSQMVEGGGGGKLGDACQLLILQIVGGVKAAPGEEGVLDAGFQGIPVAHLQIEVVQLLQKAAASVVGQLPQVVAVDLFHRQRPYLHQPLPEVRSLGGAVPAFQRREDVFLMLLPQLPQPGHPRTPHRAGVRHVKDIFQMGPPAVPLPDEGDPLAARLDPAAHGVVPQPHLRAGRCVRALGKDEKLFIKGVLIEPCGGG